KQEDIQVDGEEYKKYNEQQKKAGHKVNLASSGRVAILEQEIANLKILNAEKGDVTEVRLQQALKDYVRKQQIRFRNGYVIENIGDRNVEFATDVALQNEEQARIAGDRQLQNDIDGIGHDYAQWKGRAGLWINDLYDAVHDLRDDINGHLQILNDHTDLLDNHADRIAALEQATQDLQQMHNNILDLQMRVQGMPNNVADAAQLQRLQQQYQQILKDYVQRVQIIMPNGQPMQEVANGVQPNAGNNALLDMRGYVQKGQLNIKAQNGNIAPIGNGNVNIPSNEWLEADQKGQEQKWKQEFNQEQQRVNQQLGLKANAADVYRKDEVDQRLINKVDGNPDGKEFVKKDEVRIAGAGFDASKVNIHGAQNVVNLMPFNQNIQDLAGLDRNGLVNLLQRDRQDPFIGQEEAKKEYVQHRQMIWNQLSLEQLEEEGKGGDGNSINIRLRIAELPSQPQVGPDARYNIFGGQANADIDPPLVRNQPRRVPGVADNGGVNINLPAQQPPVMQEESDEEGEKSQSHHSQSSSVHDFVAQAFPDVVFQINPSHFAVGKREAMWNQNNGRDFFIKTRTSNGQTEPQSNKVQKESSTGNVVDRSTNMAYLTGGNLFLLLDTYLGPNPTTQQIQNAATDFDIKYVMGTSNKRSDYHAIGSFIQAMNGMNTLQDIQKYINNESNGPDNKGALFFAAVHVLSARRAELFPQHNIDILNEANRVGSSRQRQRQRQHSQGRGDGNSFF
ncbi:MAG: hypothetical protein O3A66_02300, partial [Proteobacteria bacterium]|nr:hypothetical protein [Pseudomonadota bacterium]